MSLERLFIDRLTAINPQVFALIDGASAYASLTGEPKATPAAYVLVEAETSGENMRATGPVLQRLESDVAVVIVTKNVSDNTGAAAAEDLGALKTTVRDALIGFIPAVQGGEAVTHVEANLLKLKNGHAWHRELFATASTITEKR